MATVRVPAEFFRSELRLYSDWREAFARELLQNSIDAGATHIDVTFGSANGHGIVTFQDDGCGMDRRVLEDVFFALGETTKHSEDSIGGFGRARVVICFAQRSYRIRTRNLLVTGQGGEYVAEECGDFFDGCEFQVDLIDGTPDRVRASLEDLLRSCSLQVTVVVDGKQVAPTPVPSRAARVMRGTDNRPWARAYIAPERLGQLFVRVHGLTMFWRWIPGRDDVILELIPARSREVMVATRDRLADGFDEEIDRFCSELSSNRRKALRPETGPVEVRVAGGGFMHTLRTGGPASGRTEPAPATAIHGPGLQVQTAAYRRAQIGAPVGGTGERGAHAAVAGLGFDCYLFADDQSPRIRRLLRKWDPTRWVGDAGRRRRALLLAWKQAVEFCLAELLRRRPEVGDVSWTVGWVFDTEVGGTHRQVGTIGHVLALNPVGPGETMRYRLSSRADRWRLLVVAAHEVAHIAASGHDELYAGILTELIGALSPTSADRALRRGM